MPDASGSSSGTPPAPEPRHDPYAAIRIADYRTFAGGFLFSSTGLQMLGAAVAWEVYARTNDPLAIGLIGLCRALPVVLLCLPAGHVADTFSRKWVLVLTQLAFAALAGALAVASYREAPVWVFYVLLTLMGCARSFNGPSRSSLLPLLVPSYAFPNAVMWNSGVFQASAMLGPVLAGVLMSGGSPAWPVYAMTAGASLIYAGALSRVDPAPQQRTPGRFTLASMFAGMSHVWRERTIFGAITLDLFAVLLGGATALLPIYAKDIIHAPSLTLGFLDSPETRYGLLRAAPFIGALAMSLLLAHRPPFRRAGSALLWSVAGFGVCTIVFGFSTSFWLSLGMLFSLGALDTISVVIRHVLVQVRTPDALRGRVGAVNSVFIECSNELGAFESGLVAKYFGAVVSAVSGGIGTILVVAVIALSIPELRKMRELNEQK